MRHAILESALVALALVLAVAAPLEAASQYQPHLRFRVLATPHFRIYHHQGEEGLAQRLARIAESAHSTLPGRIRLEAPPVTHVVLANQDDDANGLATPIPYCTVRISGVWPSASELTGNTDDWLRLVFIHEWVHILQLDRSVGWAAVARKILGRSPVAFPNLFLPQWQVEGFATFWESRATGFGRLNGGDSEAIVGRRARVGQSEPIDRVNGGLVDWPDGYAPYLDGAWFYDYLANRFGEDAVGRLANVTAGRFLYLSSPAFKRVFGQSLGSLWTDFQRDLRKGPPVVEQSSPAPRRLTRHGFLVTSPRFDASGRQVLYALRDADRFPSLMLTALDGGTPRSIASRFGGTHLSVRRGLVYFDQVELQDNVAWRSDLYVADLRTGRSRRLTRDARLLEPDVSPDGRKLACLRVAEDGRLALAFFSLIEHGETSSLSPAEVAVRPDERASYGSPRWSPDGRRLAVERRRLEGPSEIVVFDVGDGSEQVVASSSSTRNLTPAWMPDGDTLLFASDRGGQSFQVFAVSRTGDGLRRVTQVAGGATYPEVSPDGRRLVYVGSDATGYDLFEVAIEPGAWTRAGGAILTPGAAVAGNPASDGSAASLDTTGTPAVSSAYSPLRTLLPRAWTPLADSADGRLRLGFAVDGVDVLSRHAFGVSVLWRLGGTTAIGGGHGGRPDWTADYVYDRWRPAFFAAASDRTSFLGLATAGGRTLPDAELRERSAAAGVAFQVRRVRHAQMWQAAFNVQRDTLTATGDSGFKARNALRTAWAVNTAKTYGRSISVEDGVSASVTSEQVRTGFGADGDADAFTGEIRAFLRPGSGHAVLAARAGYGVSTGDTRVRREFYLGGSSSAGSLVNFGSNAFRMLRGFDDQLFAGTHVAVATVEWRQPGWRIERGWGTIPFFLRTVHGAVFVDLGHAWDSGFSMAAVKTSVGVEGSLDLVAGYGLPLTVSAGVAWTRDGAAGGRRGTAIYLRLGPSF